jgi:2,3-dihydro-2,3-dihydroxybenzoate dehydrogenase
MNSVMTTVEDPADPSRGTEAAFVTGAAGGIGVSVAQILAERGAPVALADVDAGAVRSLAAELRAAGHVAVGYQLDVRDSEAVRDTVDKAEHELGALGTLVNVAGVLQVGRTTELSEQQWRRTFAVNVDGVFHASRAVVERMMPRRSGCIVTVASNAAGVPRHGMAAYAASKAAAAQFTRCLGLEVAEHGIRCNVVCPGSTETDMLRSMWTDEDGLRATLDGDPAAYRVGIPLRKLATPRDIAEAVAFLASDAAGHITMQDLYVDGGAALRA